MHTKHTDKFFIVYSNYAIQMIIHSESRYTGAFSTRGKRSFVCLINEYNHSIIQLFNFFIMVKIRIQTIGLFFDIWIVLIVPYFHIYKLSACNLLLLSHLFLICHYYICCHIITSSIIHC